MHFAPRNRRFVAKHWLDTALWLTLRTSHFLGVFMFTHHPRLIKAKATSLGAVIALSACLHGGALAADLTVIVNNVQQDAGQVMLGLFNTPEGFPKTISQGTMAPAKERSPTGQIRLVFKDLAPGQYVATAYHDLDSNGKLNANLMGLPTEPYGFSNNARSNFGPPSFKDAAISLGDKDLTIEVTLK
jgi:uncharacterized protein (DUF2141 family)